MRVIRLKMYQEMARFNNPSAPRGADCYPLPPFSTVNGFIHSMCQWKKYHKLDYFVTGKGVYNTKTQKEWHGGKRFNKVSDEMLKRWDIITDYTDGSLDEIIGAENRKPIAEEEISEELASDILLGFEYEKENN